MSGRAATRVRLRILKIKISGFWREFRRSKAGILGLFLMAAFIFVAAFGPSIAPNDPNAEGLANPLSLPQLLTILPQYSNLSRSLVFDVQWSANSTNALDFQHKEDPGLASMLNEQKSYVWSVQYIGNSSGEVELKLTFNFTYNYEPPESIKSSFRWRALNLSDMGYNLELSLIKYSEVGITEYSLWDSNFKTSSPQRNTNYSTSYDIPGSPLGFPRYVTLGSARAPLFQGRLGFNSEGEFLSETFSSQGSYGLAFYVRLLPTTNASTGEVQIFDFDFHTLGAVYGLLGTDNRGRDIFSRIIYGTRISLEVGLLVACLSTAIGVAAGVASGYFGGAFDEVSMRLVDLMMCLPFFPLLLAFADMFQRNLWIIMFLIVLWGWGGLARIVRSQVLSLREMPFIEAAVATGASKTYILRKHILPNVFPLIFSFLVLAVPGAILTESGLSFLGLGDPTLVTWGRIINEAMNGGALAANAWWWLFAPGVAIVLVCLSFVLVARAFDKIVNPRLRTRT